MPMNGCGAWPTMKAGSLAVWKVTLYDSASKQSTPFARLVLDPTHWRTAAEFDGVQVLTNARALPRAWLVTAAEEVDGEEALRRIRGESSSQFDPLRTARTGRRLGIVSDARYRFERGVDPEFVVPGLELATRIILRFCGGEPGEIVVAGRVPEWRPSGWNYS